MKTSESKTQHASEVGKDTEARLADMQRQIDSLKEQVAALGAQPSGSVVNAVDRGPRMTPGSDTVPARTGYVNPGEGGVPNQPAPPIPTDAKRPTDR